MHSLDGWPWVESGGWAMWGGGGVRRSSRGGAQAEAEARV